ncbi:hypothetical protein [Streptomyces sp. NBC_01716]|uniref:hypothetical protein n=1 Tax=Streptomyces sp. NBC_01716 TaxID=2975917 RepID=UPI002E379D5D|nr:hypothetical protein [Streptomyces sp. NBC_01716]
MNDTTAAAHQGAACELGHAFRAAGLGALSVVPMTDRGTPKIALSAIDPETAVEVARLIRKALTRTHKVADSLRSAFEAHDLDLPDLGVENNKVSIGHVSLPAADRLARLLGEPDRDPGSAIGAQTIADRLRTGFKRATGGVLRIEDIEDPRYHRGRAGLSLKAIDVNAARRLLMALQFGA